MTKIWIIAKREYRLAVTRWPFWLVTIGLPLFIAAIGSFSVLAAFLAATSGEPSIEEQKQGKGVIGIVDPTPVMDWESFNHLDSEEEESTPERDVNLTDGLVRRLEIITSSPRRVYRYRYYQSQEAAMAALREREIGSFLDIPDSFPHGGPPRLILLNSKDNVPSLTMTSRDLRRHFLSTHWNPQETEQILNPLSPLETVYLEENTAAQNDITQELRQSAVPMVFMILLLLAVATSTDRLLRGLVEEKANRVIEILLSSATSDQIMAGKVIGLGMTGLTQISIWLLLGLLPMSFAVSFITINIGTIAIVLLFFVLGYFFLATIITGVGSLGNNLQEANQWTVAFILISVLPMFFFPVLMREPDGVIAVVLTYAPFCAPFATLFRFASDAISIWEIALSAFIILVSIRVALFFSARIFRAGILLTGKPPSPKLLFEALRSK